MLLSSNSLTQENTLRNIIKQSGLYKDKHRTNSPILPEVLRTLLLVCLRQTLKKSWEQTHLENCCFSVLTGRHTRTCESCAAATDHFQLQRSRTPFKKSENNKSATQLCRVWMMQSWPKYILGIFNLPRFDISQKQRIVELGHRVILVFGNREHLSNIRKVAGDQIQEREVLEVLCLDQGILDNLNQHKAFWIDITMGFEGFNEIPTQVRIYKYSLQARKFRESRGLSCPFH